MSTHIAESPHLRSYNGSRKRLAELIQRRLIQFAGELASQHWIDLGRKFECILTPHEPPSIEEQRHVEVSGSGLDERLTATVQLGSKLKEWNLGLFPRITERGSFYQHGLECFIIAQFARSPGVFFTFEDRKESRIGEHGVPQLWDVKYAVAEIRTDYGANLTIKQAIRPTDGGLFVSVDGGKQFGLWHFLSALGLADSKFESEVVSDCAQSVIDEARTSAKSTKKDYSQTVREIAKAVGSRVDEHTGIEQVSAAIQDIVFSSELGHLGRAQVNRRTGSAESVTALSLHDICQILDLFSRFKSGEIEMDDPWSLSNLRIRLVGDQVEDAVDEWWRWIERRVRKALKEIDGTVGEDQLFALFEAANSTSTDGTLFTRIIRERLFGSSLCQRITRAQNNYVQAAALTRRVTCKGRGGIGVKHERVPRDFHWSHYGRLCPLDTPQSNDVGITLSLTVGARVNELGILESRCRKVDVSTGEVRVDEEDVFISPWQEESESGWIAFPDQLEALQRSDTVAGHLGRHVLEQIDAKKVSYIHVSEADLFSISANLIPHRAHTDALRGVMTCSFLRQALPLIGSKAPSLATEYESALPANLDFRYGNRDDDTLALGRELVVAYMPWKGWNFEDAIVISESAAKALTSSHDMRMQSIHLIRKLEDQEAAFLIRENAAKAAETADATAYDSRGIIRPGIAVESGFAAVLEPGHALTARAIGTLREHTLEIDGRGTIKSVEAVNSSTAGSHVRVTVTDERKAAVGDKLANRYGHKGVISRVEPDRLMPYVLLGDDGTNSDCDCGEARAHKHAQVLINPLSVISRMNLGQLEETVKCRGADWAELPARLPCFARTDSKEITKFEGDLLIGEQYLMKLDHNAADKVSGRARQPGSYSEFVEQPLKGKRLQGGQRLGEMEMWALMAHNADAVMQEALTTKADNPKERYDLFWSLLSGEEVSIEPKVPEAVKTLASFCHGLGLDLILEDLDGGRHDALVESLDPDNIGSVKLSLINTELFLKSGISGGEVSTYVSAGRLEKKGYRYHSKGLESEQIFGPVKSFQCACGKTHPPRKGAKRYRRKCNKCGVAIVPASHRRHRMGHIQLVRPVPNPYILINLKDWLGMDCRAFLEDWPKFNFEKSYRSDNVEQAWENVYRFCELALRASEPFRDAIEIEIGVPIAVEGNLDTDWQVQLAELYRGMVTDKGGHTIDEFVAEMVSRYGENRAGLKRISRFMADTLRSTGLCTIDFLDDLLRNSEQMKSLSLPYLPVIPPPLRNRYKVNNRHQPHDLTILYRQVLDANTELQALLDSEDASDEDWQSQYRKRRVELQRRVGQLMCNEALWPRLRSIAKFSQGKPVRKSIAGHLQGKKGLLIGNLLGKRADYSGRAVIVPDPELPLDTCRLPLALVVDVFEPHLILALKKKAAKDAENKDTDDAESVVQAEESAKKEEAQHPESVIQAARSGNGEAIGLIRDVVDDVLADKVVLLNRQPTLHRLGILAFKVKAGVDNVIAIPPMVVAGFNADFDGDQMAVHLPISESASEQALEMMSVNQLWHPADGRFALSVTQDLKLGAYLSDTNRNSEVLSLPEEQAESPKLIEAIEEFQRRAFAEATKSAISFSLEDLRAFGEEYDAMSDSCRDYSRIQSILNGLDESNPLKRIVLSGARGRLETLNQLAGRVDDQRRRSNLAFGLQVGEQLEQVFSARRNLVNTKLGTAEGGTLTIELVGRAHRKWITEEDCKAKTGITVGPVELVTLPVHRLVAPDLQRVLDTHCSTGSVIGALWNSDGKGCLEWQELPNGADEHEQKAWQVKVNAILTKRFGGRPPKLEAIRIRRAIPDDESGREKLFRKLYGRVLAEDVDDALTRGSFLGVDEANDLAERVLSGSVAGVTVRSPARCDTEGAGICRTCYGMEWSRGRHAASWDADNLVRASTRVGVIAAQAVGEPGTQMALRQKHEVGAADALDDPFIGIGSVHWIIDNLSGEAFRDSLGYVYQANGIQIASVHFETLENRSESGWLGMAAQTANNDDLHQVLVNAALEGAVDDLRGLKERVMIGARLPV